MSTHELNQEQALEVVGQDLRSNSTPTFKFEKNIDPAKVKFRNLAIYDEPDLTFAQYGHILYKILTVNGYGRVGFGQGYRLWEQNNEFKKFLPKNVPFYPHEEVTNQLRVILYNQLKESRFSIESEHDSHGGFAHYWIVLSDKFNRKLTNSYRVDDVVQVGFQIRNGIDIDIALGFDFFTNCLRCMNGAIARGSDIGTFAIRHAGNYDRMKEIFLQYIPLAVEKAQHLVDIYDKSTSLVMNQTRAEKFFKKVKASTDYFPDYFNIDKDKRKDKDAEINDIVKYNGKDRLTVWETFNDFSHDLWHSGKLGFSGKRQHLIGLHNALFDIVASNGNGVGSATASA